LWTGSVDTASSFAGKGPGLFDFGRRQTYARPLVNGLRLWRWALRKLAVVNRILPHALIDVQSVFVNDSEIELRLDIASFGGFK
jgi:hypothetical protein